MNDNATTITSYPLSWPVGWKRTPSHAVRRSQFGSYNNPPTTFKSISAVQHELRLLGAREVVISTNLELRNDGLPRGSSKAPRDAGVAVYFQLNKQPRVLACDRWYTVGENLWAIAKHIEALRGQDRWGVGTLDQAFTGYAALPPGDEEHWSKVLGLSPNATPDEVQARYRELVQSAHPDHGGSADTFNRITAARKRALER